MSAEEFVKDSQPDADLMAAHYWQIMLMELEDNNEMEIVGILANTPVNLSGELPNPQK